VSTSSLQTSAGRFPALGRQLLAAAIVVLAAAFAYHNSLGAPFVFDDVSSIVENQTIRALGKSLQPPRSSGLTVNGRPVVNFSLAVNYALGGLNPRGYHLLNLAIHAGAGLALFGVVRRTLQRTRFNRDARLLALLIAVLWVVHPLQTEAVTYVVQRSEALMALFYLLTLYGFIRAVESSTDVAGITRPERSWWQGVALGACALGMATKEVMVSAPFVVLLYDWIFLAGTFRAAMRARWRFYGLLAATWLLLGWLMVSAGGRGGTAGFSLGVPWWAYALKQCDAIVHYLRLVFWPDPLVFDYGGMVLVRRVVDVLPQALLLATLLVLTIVALRRWRALGFLGVAFFAILAPTSSVVPVADTLFEHRMYLPLAAVATLVVLGIYRIVGRWTVAVCGVLALALGWTTTRRNEDYQSEIALWGDTVAKRPDNVRARYTFGSALFQAGRVEEAIRQFEIALSLKPDSAPTLSNLGNALARTGRIAEAISRYEAALRIAPDSADAHNNLANALIRVGRIREARQHYEAALGLRPAFADAHNNLGNVLAQLGNFSGAAEHYEAALQLRPDLADAQANLGNVLAQTGRLEEALPHYEAALRLRPNFLDAHFNFATALAELGRWRESAAQYEAVLQLRPDHQAAQENLARVRAQQRSSSP
jgi:tetratricopeptide (TPR) repeat protein